MERPLSPYSHAAAIHAVAQPDTYVIDDNDYIKTGEILEPLSMSVKTFNPSIRTPQIYQRYHFSPIKDPLGLRLIRIPGRNAKSVTASTVPLPLCEIIHANLANITLEYETLSYVWGDLEDFPGHCPVFVETPDGQCVIMVIQSLFLAIRRLQNDDSDSCFWIDHLCINQHDPAERAQQVSLISKIFKHATRTIVWLGEEKQDLCSAYDYFFHNVKSMEEEIRNQSLSTEDPIWRLSLNFLANPWFNRLWVFQEVVLSSSIMICYGSMKCDFQDLVDTNNLRSRLQIQNWTKGMQTIHIMKCYQHVFQVNRSAISLLHILMDTRATFECYDPRDRVYALLNIIESNEASLSLIDYTISVENLYIKTAHYLVTSSRSLMHIAAIFSHRNHGNVASGGNRYGSEDMTLSLPSWVPDWTIKTDQLGVEMSTNTKFSAARGRAHAAIQPSNPRLLEVKGKVVDSVYQTMPVDFEYESTNCLREIFPLYDLARSILGFGRDGLSTPSISEATIYETLLLIMKTATADGVLDIQYSPKRPLSRDELDHMIKIVYLDENRLENNLDSEAVTALNNSCLRVISLLKVSKYRRLAILENRPLALVPGSAQLGDLVCILHGSTVPVLLRRHDNRYVVLGQCYVEGLMYGEGLDWDVDAAETFVIE